MSVFKMQAGPNNAAMSCLERMLTSLCTMPRLDVASSTSSDLEDPSGRVMRCRWWRSTSSVAPMQAMMVHHSSKRRACSLVASTMCSAAHSEAPWARRKMRTSSQHKYANSSVQYFAIACRPQADQASGTGAWP